MSDQELLDLLALREFILRGIIIVQQDLILLYESK